MLVNVRFTRPAAVQCQMNRKNQRMNDRKDNEQRQWKHIDDKDNEDSDIHDASQD